MTRDDKNKIISQLQDYFLNKEAIVMAFVFGSWARNQEGMESDLDIAVYFKPGTNVLEWQEPDAHYDAENQIWMETERIAGREIDLLVLNRAPATIAESALKGIPLVVKNRRLFMDLLLRVTSEAIDFREWINGYWNLKESRRRETAA